MASAITPILFMDTIEDMCCVDECATVGQEKYYSIDTKHNMCGECCMAPADYPMYKRFEKGLTKAPDGDFSPCTTLGFSDYDSTVTHGFASIKMTLDLYNPDEASYLTDTPDCTVERKVDQDLGTCGELCIDGSIKDLMEKHGGVTPGSCAELDYTIFDHTEEINAGPLGHFDVDVYTKGYRLTDTADCTVERKVDTKGGTCGEMCLDASIKDVMEKHGGVAPGACADLGYTVFDHTEQVSAGPLGKFDVDVYTQ